MFVDAGAFIAWFFPRDQHHAQATKAWRLLRETTPALVTSDLVLAEAFDFMAYRVPIPAATEAARRILTLSHLTVIEPTAADSFAALDLMEDFADQDFSFTDAVSFVLMRRLKVARAFAFDHHFSVAGFEVWPGADAG